MPVYTWLLDINLGVKEVDSLLSAAITLRSRGQKLIEEAYAWGYITAGKRNTWLAIHHMTQENINASS